jgi:Restriction endonuclease
MQFGPMIAKPACVSSNDVLRERTMPEQKWKRFEKLVAAINRAMARGATVKWNDHINGRQFDVTIRFRLADLYDFLTVVECRDEKNRIEATDVEAFVTKSQDSGANKAVMVSASGFQSGAVAVAQKHGIELYTLTQVQSVPDDLLTNYFIPVLNVYRFKLHLTDGGEFKLPERPNECNFFLKNMRLKTGNEVVSLNQIVQDHCRRCTKPSTEPQEAVITFPAGTIAVRPDTMEELAVSTLSFTYQIITARLVKPGTRVDPHIFSTAYRLRNDRTGKSTVVPAVGLRPGFDTKLRVGGYYRDAGWNFAYLCEAVDGDKATMFLVEAYQHGQAIQASFIMSVQYADYYEEITDAGEIERLEKVYRSNAAHQKRMSR